VISEAVKEERYIMFIWKNLRNLWIAERRERYNQDDDPVTIMF
jgi:hypothetical protein